MEKLTMQDYLNCLQAKKQEAHDKQWLYIEVNAKDLLEECEPGIRNQDVYKRQPLITGIRVPIVLTDMRHRL